jgi:hypothetical protein
MKPIELKDLNPQGAEITLRKTGKTYRLRPVNLADEKWMAETFGNDLEKIFRDIQMVQIMRIVFHQLEHEDKVDFRQQDVEFMNEEGVTITKKIGGAELLFWMIEGMEEKIQIFQALMKTIGISRAMIDGELSEEEKKSPVSLQTGP